MTQITRIGFRWMMIAFFLAISSSVLAQENSDFQDSPPDPAAATLTLIADGFRRPLGYVSADDGTGRMFVMEQGGVIWIVQDDERLPEPFMDVSDKISPDALGNGYSERGLLGLVFHPAFAENGTFYINYTDLYGNTVIARYLVSPDDANRGDESSEAILMQVAQPFANHNGGHIAFGPDGYLYIALGDGGAAGDPLGAGQDTSVLLGKILRIDVDNADAGGYTIPSDNPFVGQEDFAAEIWLYGVRNPWRFSFDRLTGDLYVADVGQNQWEEVNFVPAGQAGANLGWNIYEATHAYSGAPAPSDMVLPIAEYAHNLGISVTGGFVYRGEAIADWQGAYLYGDFGSGMIWAAYRDASGDWNDLVILDSITSISSFGQDEAGELYVVDYNGGIYRFSPNS